MGYQDMLKAAQESKQMKKLSPVYMTWEKNGQSIVGRLMGVNEISGVASASGYNQYLVDTDDGPVKFAMGHVADGEVGRIMRIGGVYLIEYQGQEKIKGGRRVNRFDVRQIVSPDAREQEQDENAPF